jgi:16S rRNA (adenine1518-N6/adenine1519-N6)-dimethyltransferase
MRQQLITNNQIAKKSLGQNFITNNKFLLEMNKFIESSNNNILIEIGPGKGALTGYLTKKKYKKLYLIEKDYLLASRLKETYKNSNNIIVIQGDALSYNYNKFLNESDRVVIYGNLPFNISTRLLSLWLGSIKWPSFYDKMVLMFQKEVAERILAKNNNKKYGRLSVLVQARCNVKKLLDAPASIFSPKPKVDGIVIQFEPIKDFKEVNYKKLEKLLEKSFSSRRKKIKNTLKEYRSFLLKLKIDDNLRPENLSVSDYCNLVRLIN